MAILKAFPGLQVSLTVDGVQAKEHHNADEDEASDKCRNISNHIISYVETRPGARFAVAFKWDNKFLAHVAYPLEAKLIVDGVPASRCKFNTEVLKLHGEYSISHALNYGQHGKAIKRDLIFTELRTIEGDASIPSRYPNIVNQIKNFGEVTVTLHRLRVDLDFAGNPLRVWRNMPARPNNKLSELYTLGDIPEKVLKGRSLSVRSSFGEESPLTPFLDYQYSYLDPHDHPMATFTFRYRTMNDLRVEGILPLNLTFQHVSDSESTLMVKSEGKVSTSTVPVKFEDTLGDTLMPRSNTVKCGKSARPMCLAKTEQDINEIKFLSSRSLKRGHTIAFPSDEEIIDLTID